MLNETLISFSNSTLPVTLTVTSKTSWWQFVPAILISGVMTLWIMARLFAISITQAMISVWLYVYRFKTGRKAVLIKHNSAGMFFPSMITTHDAERLSGIMQKMGGKDFDLIIHSPGGDLFASMLIAKLILKYPGKISAIVPSFAMSGGTFIALACDNIIMNEFATLGPVDVQIGMLWSMGSARAWEDLKKYKGKKIADNSFVMSHLSKRAAKDVVNFVKPLIIKHSNNPDAVKMFTSGDVMHAHQFFANDLAMMGFRIFKIDRVLNKIFFRLINSQSVETVIG